MTLSMICLHKSKALTTLIFESGISPRESLYPYHYFVHTQTLEMDLTDKAKKDKRIDLFMERLC